MSTHFVKRKLVNPRASLTMTADQSDFAALSSALGKPPSERTVYEDLLITKLARAAQETGEL